MSKTSYVKDSNGNVTHVRETSDDHRSSYLYEYDDSISGQLLNDGKGSCVEVTEHNPNGTSDSYEADDSLWGQIFGGGKGSHK